MTPTTTTASAPAQLTLFDDLAAAAPRRVAVTWSRDLTVAELALLCRLWPTTPVRVQVIGLVLLSMGGQGRTHLTASEIGALTGRSPAAVRRHLTAAYSAAVLAQVQHRRRTSTVRRVITRGRLLLDHADYWASTQPSTQPTLNQPSTNPQPTLNQPSDFVTSRGHEVGGGS